MENELLIRIQNQFNECSLVVRRLVSNGLSVYGIEREAKKKVEEPLQQTRESADNCFFDTACNDFPVWRGIVVEQKKELPSKGYAVIRCQDGAIVARLHSFPDSGRALMYRRGDEVSFMPLQDDEIIGTPTLFTEMLDRIGIRISSRLEKNSLKM